MLARTLLAALAALLLAAAPARAGEAAWVADSPYATHSMVYLDAPYGFKRAMFREAAESGASTIRLDLALSGIWTDRTPDWRRLDEVVALSREFRLPVSAVLLAQPWFVARCADPADEPRDFLCPPGGDEGYALYGELLEQVARRTRGTIELFEVLNEPDGDWAFRGGPADYAQMLTVGHDAIERGNPAARVLLGGVMSLDSRPFLEAVFGTPGLDAARAFDVANVHVRGPVSSLPGTIAAWRAFFARHGAGDRPLWVTEFGYPADPAHQYDPGLRGGEADQATYLRHALPVLLRSGVDKVFVSLRDLDWAGPFASEGIVAGGSDLSDQPVLRRRPAFDAFAALAGVAPARAADAQRAAEQARFAEDVRAALERATFAEDVRAALQRARYAQDVRAALERAAAARRQVARTRLVARRACAGRWARGAGCARARRAHDAARFRAAVAGGGPRH